MRVRTFGRSIALAGAVLMSSGCGSVIKETFGGEASAIHYFVLEAPPCTPQKEIAAFSDTIAVDATSASVLLGSEKIVFAPSQIERGYYFYSRWTEAPSARLPRLIIGRLQCEERFAQVVSTGSLIPARYLLRSELLDLTHYSESSPGKAVISMRVELYDVVKRVLLGTQVVTRETELESYDAEGAVAAFSASTGALLEDISKFIVASIERQDAPPATKAVAVVPESVEPKE